MPAQVYGPLTLPKSGKVIYFKEPLGSDRLDVLKQNQIGTDDVVSASTLVGIYLSARCITKVDDKDSVGDYKHIMDSWPNYDVDYYQALFNKMFTMDQAKLDELDNTADFLLKNSGSTASSTSTSNATGQ